MRIFIAVSSPGAFLGINAAPLVGVPAESLGVGLPKEARNALKVSGEDLKARSETEPARLLGVDDHAFVRLGIVTFLTNDPTLTVAGEAKDGEEAVALCRELHPDLVLMDLSMPGMGGIEATRMIKAHLPETSVLILTGHAEEDHLMEALRAGAAGYVVHTENPTRLLDAVRLVLEGHTPLDQELAGWLLRRIAAQTASPQADTFGNTRRTRPWMLYGRISCDIMAFSCRKENEKSLCAFWPSLRTSTSAAKCMAARS